MTPVRERSRRRKLNEIIDKIDEQFRRLYELVIGVAEGRVSKAAVAVFFEQHAS